MGAFLVFTEKIWVTIDFLNVCLQTKESDVGQTKVQTDRRMNKYEMHVNGAIGKETDKQVYIRSKRMN